MDRNDSNPGMVERQMDETPMEGRSVESETGGMSGADRDSLQRDGSVEREGMQGSEGMERDSMSAGGSRESEMQGSSSRGEELTGRESERLGESNTSSNPAQMSASAREGGYGYDRPADLTVGRDTMEGSSRDTDQGTDRAPRVSDTDATDQPRGTTTA
ncbi:MAG TPA: hypothetical protein VEX86_13730, partial [Longimicrobium sp.]|nr:hypothetical protein [Longimicrobium sp.]